MKVTPSSMCCSSDPPAHVCRRVRKLTPGIDPHTFVGIIDFDTLDSESLIYRESDDIGDIELALGVIRAQGSEPVAKQIGAE